MTDTAYLDYNATAPTKPAVAAAVAEALALGGNPSSVHGPGRRARDSVERARASVATLVGAAPEQVVFTSGATEANNQALSTAVAPLHGCERILASSIEHDSVLGPSAATAVSLTTLAVGADGVLDLGGLEIALAADPRRALVSVMWANNETGVVQPVAEAAAIAHRNGALFHCDAAQAPGKIAIDIAPGELDLLSLSAHKLAGPPGIGALVTGAMIPVEALLRGGGQERRRRGGTENVPAIVGFGEAAELAQHDVARAGAIGALRDRLETRIAAIAGNATTVYGAAAARLPNTSCFSMAGVSAEIQVIALDLAGCAVSAGSACSSGKVSTSHVLTAMGVPDDEAATAIRVSLGWASKTADIDRLIEAWSTLYRRAGRATAA